MMRITIIMPVYNEEAALSAAIEGLQKLDPAPDEVLIVDGHSDDGSVKIIQDAGLQLITSPKRGRAAQINHGAAAASGDIICILHADSILPIDAISVMKNMMANHKIALAGFTPRISGPSGTRWGSSLHNWLKTWYTPMLFRPKLFFFHGVRLLYGDHAMFFRRTNFLEIGGCDERVSVMEEADLCIKLSRFGKTKILNRWVWTSDRRIAAWGRWRANYIYLKVGLMWAFGARERLADHYPDIR